MNRRLLLLDLVLVLFAAGLVWLLRDHFHEARAREKTVLTKKVVPPPVLAPPALAPVRPAPPSDYVDVAQKTLFSKDRNPNVPIDAPKPPPPEPPMPALPIYHGQMNIGEPVAILSLPSQASTQKGYHAGDDIGDFKLVAFDADKIELQWHGKTIERKPEELVAKEAPPPTPAPVVGGSPAAGTPGSANSSADASGAKPAKSVTSLGPSSGGSGASSAAPSGLGPEIAPGVRNCLPGDDSPAGTVLNGYKKRLIPSMFGSVCRWEQVN